jgi:hippurate hydrolase
VVVKDDYTPAAYNDPALTAAAADVFRAAFGAGAVVERRPEMIGEDFGRYAPDPGPTLATGVRAMTHLVLGLLAPAQAVAERAGTIPGIGSVTVNVVPRPGALATAMSPPS